MDNGDYRTALLFMEERLRDAERERNQRDLIRLATENNGDNRRVGLRNRIMQLVHLRPQPQAQLQEATDVRRATAV